MPSIYLHLQLVSPASFPESAASLGGGRTLRFIPGATLLGAVAARLYDAGDPRRMARLFHDGVVRFGNGWPGRGGRPSVMVPRCFHVVKGKDPSTTAWRNLSTTEPQTEQYVAVDGWVDDTRALAHVPTNYSLRTATDGRGAPKAGLLYGLETVDAGQSFYTRVDADDEALLTEVRTVLVDRTVMLGRSRGAELGECVVSEAAPWGWEQDDGTSAVVFFLSDTALRDPHTLAPSADVTILAPGWNVDWERSFIRTRSWSGYNQFRRTWTSERLVITAGSVVVFRQPPPTESVGSLRAGFARGVGEHRSEGLGQVLVNWRPTLQSEWSAGAEAAPEPVAVLEPDDPLFRWLKERCASSTSVGWADEQARALATLFAGRRLSASQWRDLARLARRHGPDRREDFAKEFTDHATHGLRKLKGAWGASFAVDGQVLRLWEAVVKWVGSQESGKPALVALAGAAERLAENAKEATEDATY